MNVVYVLADFPVRSERFVVREIAALHELGVGLRLLTMRPGPGAETAAPEKGPELWRRPPWWSLGLWIPAIGAALRRPRTALRLLTLARAAGTNGRGWRRARAVRLTVLALCFASRLRRHPPDVVHAHFASAPATLGLLIAAWLERPWGFSVHAHDLYAEPIDLPFKVRHANCVLACSEAAADDLRRRLPRELHPRVHTVHHGLDLETWRRRADAGSDGVPLILGVGRLEPKKGFEHLVDACAILRDEGLRFCCELIGAGREHPRLARRIARLGLHAHVRILPWRPTHFLRQDYARAAVLAVPSVIAEDGDRDNIPNVVVEALACEVPIVASALPALRRLLEPAGSARLVHPGDPRALATGLHEVVTDRELSRMLRVNGRRLATERFDPLANGRRLRELLARSSAEGAVESGR